MVFELCLQEHYVVFNAVHAGRKIVLIFSTIGRDGGAIEPADL